MQRFLIVLLFPLGCLGQTMKGDVELLMRNKQFSKAEDTLRAILKSKPNDLEALELLGDVYSNQSAWDQAIAHYKKLVELNSEVANYQYKYGGALGMKALSVNKLRAMAYLGAMEAAFLNAAKLDPHHVEARWALLRYHLHVPGILGGSKAKAWEYTNELMKISPVDGYLSKGHFHEDDQDFGKAEFYYKQAIQLGGSLTCYQQLVDLYLVSGQKQKAISLLKAGYSKLGKEELLKQLKELESND